MRRQILFRVLLVILLAWASAGCVYGKVVMPLDKDVADTQLGSRQGRASSQSVLWLVAWGDSGVEAAARAGGLTTITHLDVERYVLLFGLYGRVTTIAYGD